MQQYGEILNKLLHASIRNDRIIPMCPWFPQCLLGNQFSSEAKYLNGCNSPPDNIKTNIGQYKKGESEPILPIYCASWQVQTQDCSVPVPVVRDRRAVPAQGDLP